MIARQHRFHGYNSLSFVYRHGSTVRSEHLALRFARNQRRVTYRAAVIVSRKVHKSAVARNRVRRRLYEIIRSYHAAIAGPYDIALTVFSDRVVALPPADMAATVAGLLTKAGIISSEAVSASAAHGIVKEKEDGL